VLLANLEVLKY